jgi:hypothetical protein
MPGVSMNTFRLTYMEPNLNQPPPNIIIACVIVADRWFATENQEATQKVGAMIDRCWRKSHDYQRKAWRQRAAKNQDGTTKPFTLKKTHKKKTVAWNRAHESIHDNACPQIQVLALKTHLLQGPHQQGSLHVQSR